MTHWPKKVSFVIIFLCQIPASRVSRSKGRTCSRVLTENSQIVFQKDEPTQEASAGFPTFTDMSIIFSFSLWQFAKLTLCRVPVLNIM